jgi:hypothetical protein
MKNNKISQPGQFQDPIEKQQNTKLSGQFQHPRKTTKYHTVRTVPTIIKNNKIPHCQASSNIYEKQQNTTLSGQFQ